MVGFVAWAGIRRLMVPVVSVCQLSRWVLPVAVIVIGVVVLLRGLTFRDHREPAWGGSQGAVGAPAPRAPEDAGEPPAAVAAEEPHDGSGKS